MFLARPQHFLGYDIYRGFGAAKLMRSGVPASNATDFATLEKYHSPQAWPISAAGGNQRMKQHVRPPSAMALLSLDHVAGVIGGLLPLHFHHIPAPEVIKGLFTAVAGKTLQVEGGISSLVKGDRNRFLLHGGLPPRDKLESHLFTLRGLNHLAAFQRVALRPRHGQGLLLFVELLDAAKPPGAVAAVLIEFVLDRGELPIRLTHKSNITVSAAQLVPPDNNVRDFCLLVRVVRVQGRSIGVDLDLVAHLFEGLHEVFLLAQDRLIDAVFRHSMPPSSARVRHVG